MWFFLENNQVCYIFLLRKCEVLHLVMTSNLWRMRQNQINNFRNHAYAKYGDFLR